MGKRIKKGNIILLLILAFIFTSLIPGQVNAANIKSPYLTEQAIGKAPNVTAYVTGSKMKPEAKISAKLGEIELSQEGEIVTFKESDENIHYIILLDNSGSVNKVQFDEAKAQIGKLRESLKKGDKMSLYTVGADNPEGEKTKIIARTVKGSDSQKSSDKSKISQIKYDSSPSSMTVLYRSLNQILAEQTAPKLRTVVLLVTDGEDDSKGKDIDKVSTAEEVKGAAVPVYGVLLKRNGGGENEKMAYTRNKILAEKTCRGFYYDCTSDGTANSVKKAFETISKILKDETYVVHMKASTNRTAGQSELKLTVDNTASNAVVIDYSDYEADVTSPELAGEVTKVSADTIEFSLQDENGVNTDDANKKSNYKLQSKKNDGKGKIWTVDSASAVSEGGQTKITLKVTEKLYKGDYVLKFSDIRDNSQDGNAMDSSVEFSIEDGVNPTVAGIKNVIKSYWWILLILLVVLIGALIVRAVRKKSVKIVEVNPDDLMKADRKQIRLTITDRSGAIKDVEWDVEGSLFVGRSDICNIYFDDDRLSKQHFAIEVNKMGCYIEDLESTNGTFVNGVKITGRRMLLDGDVITAGREKLVFHVPKNQAVVNEEELYTDFHE
ncbi:MAG: FHA domain-containing protein [Lachnospiraceae bacterium]